MSKGATRQEPTAINKFNRGKVSINGEDKLSLALIDSLPISKKQTHTFCNWAMYKIQEHINAEGLDSKHTFVHLNKNDLGLLESLSHSR